jgi:hypothetical protein
LENEVKAIERDVTNKERLHIITKLMLCFALCIFSFPMVTSALKYVTKKIINKKSPAKATEKTNAGQKKITQELVYTKDYTR